MVTAEPSNRDKWQQRLELANSAATLVEKVGKGAGWFLLGSGFGGGFGGLF